MPGNRRRSGWSEGRELRGNAGQQSTRRAQDRESVSQALARVRQAAKQRRKERFTAVCIGGGPVAIQSRSNFSIFHIKSP
jgi:hypothetical protein